MKRLHRIRQECEPTYRGEQDVTVCIAAVFVWNYGTFDKPEPGRAALLVSDRMLTAGDIQYEPNKVKAGVITQGIVVQVAGDYVCHSQALGKVQERLRRNPSPKVFETALAYGAEIQAIRRRFAEDRILAPLGLNTDSFLAQQKDMSDAFVTGLTDQMQHFEGPNAEAILIGMEGNVVRLYTVDRNGTAHCFDDVGFAAIGIGGWHARSTMMQNGYHSNLVFVEALTAVYAAKRAAEVAPGVGEKTDIYLLNRNGIEPLDDATKAKLAELYDAFLMRQRASAEIATKTLLEYLNAQEEPSDPAQSEIRLTVPERTNGGTDSDSARSGTDQSDEHSPDGANQIQGKVPSIKAKMRRGLRRTPRLPGANQN